jgi:hypothetical protein
MAPFEALYGRKCRTPLYWSHKGESQFFGLEILQEGERQVQIIWDNLWTAQLLRHTKEVIDFSSWRLCVSQVLPIRGLRRFKVKRKLTPCYIGPFQILEKKGEVAYQLE